MHTSLTAIDGKLGSLTRHMEYMTGRIDAQWTRLNDVEQRVSDIEDANVQQEKSLREVKLELHKLSLRTRIRGGTYRDVGAASFQHGGPRVRTGGDPELRGTAAACRHSLAGRSTLNSLGQRAARGRGAEHRVVGARPRLERRAAPNKGERNVALRRAGEPDEEEDSTATPDRERAGDIFAATLVCPAAKRD
ncbi:hypothetical protein NDU88_010790 [Pleurodeles waltl]|uniref:t-SNARE coiled-coil homology domain-containing protein n=1 Tax=Pleurodeles waltl TaxID=8319 RepID=A0AAV7S2E0_PLEWA|nr:hypothetical protein NDU88_010790 [Pleurodeles waltl]